MELVACLEITLAQAGDHHGDCYLRFIDNDFLMLDVLFMLELVFMLGLFFVPDLFKNCLAGRLPEPLGLFGTEVTLASFFVIWLVCLFRISPRSESSTGDWIFHRTLST